MTNLRRDTILAPFPTAVPPQHTSSTTMKLLRASQPRDQPMCECASNTEEPEGKVLLLPMEAMLLALLLPSSPSQRDVAFSVVLSRALTLNQAAQECCALGIALRTGPDGCWLLQIDQEASVWPWRPAFYCRGEPQFDRGRNLSLGAQCGYLPPPQRIWRTDASALAMGAATGGEVDIFYTVQRVAPVSEGTDMGQPDWACPPRLALLRAAAGSQMFSRLARHCDFEAALKAEEDPPTVLLLASAADADALRFSWAYLQRRHHPSKLSLALTTPATLAFGSALLGTPLGGSLLVSAEALQFCLDRADINDVDPMALLELAAREHPVIGIFRAILNHPLTAPRLTEALHEPDSGARRTSIVRAAVTRGDPAVIEYLVVDTNIRPSAPIDVYSRTFDGQPSARYPAVAELLHREGITLTPASMVALSGRSRQVLRFFLDVVRVDPSAAFEGGLGRVMSCALSAHYLDVVEELCGRGVPLDRSEAEELEYHRSRWGLQQYLQVAQGSPPDRSRPYSSLKEAIQRLVHCGANPTYANSGTEQNAAFHVLTCALPPATVFSKGFESNPPEPTHHPDRSVEVLEAVDFLTDCGVRFDATDWMGHFPLSLLLSLSSPNVVATVKGLIARGLYPKDCGGWRHSEAHLWGGGMGLLHCAMNFRDVDLLRAVVSVIGLENARDPSLIHIYDFHEDALTKNTTLELALRTTRDILQYLVEEVGIPLTAAERDRLLSLCNKPFPTDVEAAVRAYLSQAPTIH